MELPATALQEFKKGIRQAYTADLYHGLLARMAERNLQRLYTSSNQMLGTAREDCCLYALLPGNIWLAAASIEDADLDGPSIV